MSLSKLARLRQLMAQHELSYYLVLSCDDHNCEYVSPCDKRRAFISEFTGSAGTAIIGLSDYAELATDGRYWLQATSQLPSDFSLRKEGAPRVTPWRQAISTLSSQEQAAVGVDPKLIPYSDAKFMLDAGCNLRAVEQNLVDQIWEGKPPRVKNPVYELDSKYTGRVTKLKIAGLRREIRAAGADAIVLTALDDIAWLLNLRGSDIEYNPVFSSFLLATATQVSLYIQTEGREVPLEGLAQSHVAVKPYDEIYEDVRSLAREGKKIWVPSGASWAMALAAGDAAILDRTSPVQFAKACKNEVEIDGAKRAQILCNSSVVEFLSWLQHEVRQGHEVSEYEAAQKLLEMRKQLPHFKDLSFETISSSGPSAAIVHYAPPKEGSRLVARDEVYLLDSGSHFLFGTTDTTRTAWFDTVLPREEIRDAYTLVLKGHIALATAVFPLGTQGNKLDLLARQYLWKHGMNYAHGTSHGVGAFLNVHEGPVGMSMHTQESVREGCLMSNEPGYYKDGEFGIRLEGLIVAKRAANLNFLEFETITFIPFDRSLISKRLLSLEEIDWIDSYHRECREQLLPFVSESAREYLLYHTEEL